MKLKIIIMALLLLAGIGSAVNYMPEFMMEPGAGIEMDSTTPGDIEMWGGNVNNATHINGSFFYSDTAPFSEETITVYVDGSDFVAKTSYGEEIYRSTNATYVIQSISDDYAAVAYTKVIVCDPVALTDPIQWKPVGGSIIFNDVIYASNGAINLTGLFQRFEFREIWATDITSDVSIVAVSAPYCSVRGTLIAGNSTNFLGTGLYLSGGKSDTDIQYIFWVDEAVNVASWEHMINIGSIAASNICFNMSGSLYSTVRVNSFGGVEKGIFFPADSRSGENTFMFGILSGGKYGIYFENETDGHRYDDGENMILKEGNRFYGATMSQTIASFYTGEYACSRYTMYFGTLDAIMPTYVTIDDNAGGNFIISQYISYPENNNYPTTTSVYNAKIDDRKWDIAARVQPYEFVIPLDNETTRAETPGFMCFNSTENKLYIYNGAAWKSVTLT